MSSDALGLVTMGVVIAALAVLTLASRLPRSVKWIICVALLLRVAGAVARHSVLFGFYEGVGDATGYYTWGLAYGDLIRSLDFSVFYDRSLWYTGEWWGTQFVLFPAAIVMAVVGPSMLGGFTAFSLLALAGLAAIGLTFHRRFPEANLTGFLVLLFLFPSLWFWPSSIGKDAIALLGLGLTVYGFAGRGERVGWLAMAVGMFLLFGVRPALTGLVGLCLVAAQWLSFRGRWTVARVGRVALTVVAGLAIVWSAAETAGIPGLDPDGVQEWVEMNPARETVGGTNVPAADVSPTGIPVALANVLARPFPWEATNPFVLLSALELLVLWGIVVVRRRQVFASLRAWRTDRLVAFCWIFVVAYSLSLGLTLVNSGIIARQRILMLPLLFILLGVELRSGATGRSDEGSASDISRSSVDAGLHAA